MQWGECSELLGKQGASQKERSLTGRQVLDIVIVENTWTWTVGNISLRTDTLGNNSKNRCSRDSGRM